MQRTLNLQEHTTESLTQKAYGSASANSSVGSSVNSSVASSATSSVSNTSSNGARSTKAQVKTELKKDASDEMTRDWISAINTSILTTLSPATQGRSKDRTNDLSRVLQSPEFGSILVGAKHLTESQGLSMEEATDRLIRSFREMDDIWRQIVIERGLKAIID